MCRGRAVLEWLHLSKASLIKGHPTVSGMQSLPVEELPSWGRRKREQRQEEASGCGIPKLQLSKMEPWCHGVLEHVKMSLLWQRKRVLEAEPWSNTKGGRAPAWLVWSHLVLEPVA